MANKIRRDCRIFIRAPSEGGPIDIHTPCRLRHPGWCKEEKDQYPDFMAKLVDYFQALAPDRSDKCPLENQKRAPVLALPACPGEVLEVYFFFRARGTSGA